MNIFKRLFTKTNKEKPKETECWYNNYNDQEKALEFNPEAIDMGASSSCELNCTKSIARR